MKVIIAGAGIAGLSAAIALQRLPYLDVELYEQAPELKEIGASIALSPNVHIPCISLMGSYRRLTVQLGTSHPGEAWCFQRPW